jgi:hypothetical protein
VIDERDATASAQAASWWVDLESQTPAHAALEGPVRRGGLLVFLGNATPRF